jgi:dipeptidyl aminopeptidase/acylaminoacyl peptidase
LSHVGGENDADFVPVAVSAVDNAVYGFETIDGFQAVVSLALDGSGTRKVVLARNDVDVDELIRIGRQRRVVGASYATEKRSVAYFDKDLAALSAKLQKALPGKPLVDIVDASADEKTLLLIASSDTDPGEVYLFDRDSYELSPLFPLRSQLAGRTMGEMKPVTFPAADGTQIPGYLTLPPGSDGKNLPAIVMPHGGPGARDEWGFDWLVQYLVARGYAVLQPNFRGSSGYGEDWFGHNGFKAWRTAIGDVDDAGRWMVRQGIADPAKLAIVGWSYGGYAALQSQVVDPDLFKAVVAIAPVTDLGTLRGENRDYTNFRLVRDFVGDGPQIDDGSPARHAQAFKAPVLLFHGTLDQNVSVEHSRLMKQRLEDAGKTVEYTEFDGTDHYIEDSDMRTKMLVEIDQFLGQSLKR